MLSIHVLLCSMEFAAIPGQASVPWLHLWEVIHEEPRICPAHQLVHKQTLAHVTSQVGIVIPTLSTNRLKLREVN